MSQSSIVDISWNPLEFIVKQILLWYLGNIIVVSGMVEMHYENVWCKIMAPNKPHSAQ